jgi:hypothetical protein
MKKLLVLLAAVLAFTCTSVAQYGSSSSSAGQTSEQTTSKSKSKKSSDQMSGEAAEKGSGKAAKESTLTGCLSKEPDASGNYTLTNGKYKKGVEVGPADKLQGHGGHKVQLTGHWKDKTKFEVASMKHISETCEMAGGGTSGTKKGKSKGGEMSEKPPKQ